MKEVSTEKLQRVVACLGDEAVQEVFFGIVRARRESHRLSWEGSGDADGSIRGAAKEDAWFLNLFPLLSRELKDRLTQ